MQEFDYKVLEDGTFAIMSYHGDEAEVVVPDIHYSMPVTLIFDCVFRGHTEITKVTLPETLTNLGGFVFDGCDNLKEITLPQSLEAIWQYAFVRSSIEEIDIPSGVKSIPPYTFKDCKALKRVTCHKGTERIYNGAFLNCTKLLSVTVAEGIDIHERAFEGCENAVISIQA